MTAAEVPSAAKTELVAEYGTPKMGIQCGRCDDWGTVVIPGHGTGREVICPVEECKAAERARLAREPR